MSALQLGVQRPCDVSMVVERNVRNSATLSKAHPATEKDVEGVSDASASDTETLSELQSLHTDEQDGDGMREDCDASSDVSDEEPTFIYENIGWSIKDILAKDSISAFAISEEYIGVGMQSGMIYVLSKEGVLQRGFSFHTAAVHSLVFDASGKFISSAGMDGYVTIAALHSSEQYRFNIGRPVRSVALEPNFAMKSTRALACGGLNGALVYSEKGWFGHKETVLHSGEGPVWNIAWHGRWIAWANDCGVRIMDASSHEIITKIPKQSLSIRTELARCTLQWRDDTTLLIAQGDHIMVAYIREKAPKATEHAIGLGALITGSPAAAFHVEITDIFQMDCLVSGLGLYDDQFLILAYTLSEDALHVLHDESVGKAPLSGANPELRTVNMYGDEQSNETIAFRDAERWQCNDYHLCTSTERVYDPVQKSDTTRPVFFLASPSQVTLARPRGMRDHIDWLVRQRKYRPALDALDALGAQDAKDLGYDVGSLGLEYLLYLIDELGDYNAAAQLFPLLLRTNVNAWEDMVLLYLERGQLPAVLSVIPTDKVILSPVVYEMVLARLLHTNETLLLATLQLWPSRLYSTQAVAAAVNDRPVRSATLLLCLAQLYLADHQPGKALEYLLELRDPTAFTLIAEHNLFTDVQNKLATLVELDQDLAGTLQPTSSLVMPLLVDNLHAVPTQRVMAQLTRFKWHRYLYLDALAARDPHLVESYANTLIELYAEYNYSKLLPFLRTMSNVYSFEKAFQICKTRDYVPEMIFLLGKTGDARGALNLIIERLHDVRMAIDFVKQQEDAELWDQLLLYAQHQPAFIRGLLEYVGGEIDPVRIIQLIGPGLKIDGLRPALVKVLQNIHMQHSLLDGCKAVLNRAAKEMVHHFQAAENAAQYCDAHTLCVVCNTPLLGNGQTILLFLCGDATHLTCVAPDAVPRSSVPVFPPVLQTQTQMHAQEAEPWLDADVDCAAQLCSHIPHDRIVQTFAQQTRELVQHWLPCLC
ncbi:Vps41p [Malassezia vespertilionis]|uniref:Vps41p n=1 Tax=Malassezia vespertilionis TaxID=2020962 RepID=A0A2N1JDQ9_9BASI|nr:Vps41p [Malassezia vespertilionis]